MMNEQRSARITGCNDHFRCASFGVFCFILLLVPYDKAYSGTLTRREIVRANASLGELRRDKEKLSSPISCELRRVKAS